MWEMGYVDVAQKIAEHNIDRLARRWARNASSVLDPHDYISDHRGLPAVLDDDFDEFEIVLGVDLIAELIRDGSSS